ncbi:hypothetical protein E4U41_005267, partial [Claviceps citrina]
MTPDGISTTKPKPHVVACASPITGHTLPIINIAAQLRQRGYPVTMLAGPEFQQRVEQAGASF